MKKRITTLIALIVVLVQLPLLAQVADTMVVQGMIGGSTPDTWLKTIIADTTSTGARKNPNRVYKLNRGDVYLLTGRYYLNSKTPLRLVADDDKTKCPPVIAPYPLADGSIPRITIDVQAVTYLKNLYFQACAPNLLRNTSDRPLSISGDHVRFTMENCIVDNWYIAGVYNGGTNTSVFIKDCLFRNIVSNYMFKGTLYFASATSSADTVSITNNTVFNGDSYFMCLNKAYTKYAKADHNTVFITMNNPFYIPYASNIDITNNIFYATCSGGETANERAQGYYDWDNQKECIVSIDTMPSDMATANGITDANRKINAKNNLYYFPKAITDLLTAKGVDLPSWMNARTLTFFNNKTQYPQIVETKTLNVDPGYKSDVMKLIDSTVAWVTKFRVNGTGTAGSGKAFYYPAGGLYFPARWPIPEDLSYTNSTVLTAGDRGLPIGDLNWFPDKKAIWLDVKEETTETIPTNFELSQNYPNPFNPTTEINFKIAKSGMVSLKVFDVLGREVTTLVNQEMNAGSYKVDFNAKGLSSGIYFYKLNVGDYNMVKKMMLLK